MTMQPSARAAPAPSVAAERVLRLLPAHVRRRDTAAGSLLAALADAVGSELEVLERDLATLYDSWFVETCPEWVLPYLADLVGVTDLPPALPGVVSRRAFVANTVAYRRRKGTPAVLEQVARDVTGWPAKVVEEFRLLATTSHVDHVRTDRPAAASVRTGTAGGADGTAAGRLDLLPTGVAQAALHALAHTADVRHIASGRGRYGIPNVAVHVFPLQVQLLGRTPARAPDGAPAAGAPWSVDPFGWATPLFTAPRRENGIEHLATEADLPVPLRPRRLLALLQDARAAAAAGLPVDLDALPVGIWVGGVPLEPQWIRVARLENLERVPDPDHPDDRAATTPLDGPQVIVDPVTGRLYPFSGGDPATPASVEVRFGYAGVADVGAGAHDRTASHEVALIGDPWTGDPRTGPPVVRDQVAVRAGGGDVENPALPGIVEGLAALAASAVAVGGTFVVAVGDSARYAVPAGAPGATVTVPPATRLVVVGAAWRRRVTGPGEVEPPVVGRYEPQGLRPRLGGTLTVTGAGAGSSVVLDGLVVEGDVVVAGTLGSLTLSSCTVGGRIRVTDADGIVVRALLSRCSGVTTGADVIATLVLQDSMLDAGVPEEPADADADGRDGPPAAPPPPQPAIEGSRLALVVHGSTVVGTVTTRTLDGSNAVLDGRVVVDDRQAGCLRYSYVARGSRVPRRFRCSPLPTAQPWVRPVYADSRRGSPTYLALAPGCPAEIAEGGEDGAEMGVHHHLGRPVRVRAAARLLDPFLPVGPELGIRSSVPGRPV